MHKRFPARGLDWSAMRTRSWCVVVVLGTVLSMSLSGGPVLAHEAHGHPAKIHEGTCEALGAVAFNLNGVGGSVDEQGAPVATPVAAKANEDYEIILSETMIDTSIDDLLAADYALMVYESDEDLTAISCGNVGGEMLGDTLVTALAEAGVPGHVGFAIFQPESEGTLVTLYVAHGLASLTAAGGGEDAHEHEEGEAHEAISTPAA